MRSSGPLRLSGYGGGRCWRLVGVAEGRGTPKGRGESGGGRTGGGRSVPKTAGAAAGTSKTPRRSPRPTTRTSVPDRARGLSTARGGEGTQRTSRSPAPDGARRGARSAASDGTRRTARSARPPAAEGDRKSVV